jgi:hypothetical protein
MCACFFPPLQNPGSELGFWEPSSQLFVVFMVRPPPQHRPISVLLLPSPLHPLSVWPQRYLLLTGFKEEGRRERLACDLYYNRVNNNNYTDSSNNNSNNNINNSTGLFTTFEFRKPPT